MHTSLSPGGKKSRVQAAIFNSGQILVASVDNPLEINLSGRIVPKTKHPAGSLQVVPNRHAKLLGDRIIVTGLYAPPRLDRGMHSKLESASAESHESRLLELWRPAFSTRQAIGGPPPRAISVRQMRKKYHCRNSPQPRRNPSFDATAGVCAQRGCASACGQWRQ